MITGEGTLFDFKDLGISGTVPEQRSGMQVEVKLKPMIFSEAMGTQDNFHPLRIICNIQLTDLGNPEARWLSFDPPVQVQVRYTFSDVLRAMNRGKPLALAYWDGNHWERFREQHKFRLEVPGMDGYAALELPGIPGDPAIGWGT